jgi:cysteinyl-tRNA synthetase
MRDDLATPQALSVIWDSIRSEDLTPEEKYGLIEAADAHLGLSLINPQIVETLTGANIPENMRDLIARREAARASKDFKEADRIRADIERSGYRVDDDPEGPVLTPTTL